MFDREKPKVSLVKTNRGGIKINLGVPYLSLSRSQIEGIAKEFHLTNAEITFNEDADIDTLINVFLGNRVYIPSLTVVNKIDLLPLSAIELIRQKGWLPVSAEKNIGLEDLKQKIWDKLEFIRVYLKPKDGPADLQKPLILKKGQTIDDAAKKIFGENLKEIKEAKIWGPSARFPGQTVSLNHLLEDQDILSLNF
jgi:hypothetical protein